jgi:hypothetical protein
MPKFKYNGVDTCRYGTALVRPGDIIEASGHPGHNFEALIVPAPPIKALPANVKPDKIEDNK